MKSDLLIEHLLDSDPILLARDHRTLRNPILRANAAGRLTRILPGVYVDAGRADDLATRVTALGRWDPDAVVCGRAAASLTYWPEVRVGTIDVASPIRHAAQKGFAFTERRIPPELVRMRGAARVTVPSLTAMELATFEFTDPIDIALRRRKASIDSLREAIDLTPHRRGHTDRRRVLLDSRDEPWSAAERLAQRIYRRAGITDWVANLETAVRGATYYLDIGFRAARVASEIDGRLVLRFTWFVLTHDPAYVIATTREALKLPRTRVGVNGF